MGVEDDVLLAFCVIHPFGNHAETNLMKEYTDDEIKTALFAMHPTKSPGPDGMSPFFFQKCWSIVNVDVYLVVRQYLQTGHSFPRSNLTHLCLIPKIKEPKESSHFQPIALCNVIIRIASKVVANRLKVLLAHVISPLQSAYVPGRLISLNTLIATEVTHFRHTLRRQEEGFFSLKLDITKAYDTLEWSFVNAMLLKLGFDATWVSPIMHGISSVTYSILLNGKRTEIITPTQGIRQDVYEAASGQKVNYQKSSIVFSSNVQPQQQSTLADILQVTKQKPSKTSQRVKWFPPAVDHLKLHVDDAFMPNETEDGVGGTLLDNQGIGVAAFTKHISGINSAKQAELEAIRAGLIWLKTYNFHNCILETDCQVVVNEVQLHDYIYLEYGNIINDIHGLLEGFEDVYISFAPRTANAVAHRLASDAFESVGYVQWMDVIPYMLRDTLKHDCNNILQ
ncbi:hypothetical protein ACLB2K_072529 [Fragaria x ananassa]